MSKKRVFGAQLQQKAGLTKKMTGAGVLSALARVASQETDTWFRDLGREIDRGGKDVWLSLDIELEVDVDQILSVLMQRHSGGGILLRHGGVIEVGVWSVNEWVSVSHGLGGEFTVWLDALMYEIHCYRLIEEVRLKKQEMAGGAGLSGFCPFTIVGMLTMSFICVFDCLRAISGCGPSRPAGKVGAFLLHLDGSLQRQFYVSDLESSQSRIVVPRSGCFCIRTELSALGITAESSVDEVCEALSVLQKRDFEVWLPRFLAMHRWELSSGATDRAVSVNLPMNKLVLVIKKERGVDRAFGPRESLLGKGDWSLLFKGFYSAFQPRVWAWYEVLHCRAVIQLARDAELLMLAKESSHVPEDLLLSAILCGMSGRESDMLPGVMVLARPQWFVTQGGEAGDGDLETMFANRPARLVEVLASRGVVGDINVTSVTKGLKKIGREIFRSWVDEFLLRHVCCSEEAWRRLDISFVGNDAKIRSCFADIIALDSPCNDIFGQLDVIDAERGDVRVREEEARGYLDRLSMFPLVGILEDFRANLIRTVVRRGGAAVITDALRDMTVSMMLDVFAEHESYGDDSKDHVFHLGDYRRRFKVIEAGDVAGGKASRSRAEFRAKVVKDVAWAKAWRDTPPIAPAIEKVVAMLPSEIVTFCCDHYSSYGDRWLRECMYGGWFSSRVELFQNVKEVACSSFKTIYDGVVHRHPLCVETELECDVVLRERRCELVQDMTGCVVPGKLVICDVFLQHILWEQILSRNDDAFAVIYADCVSSSIQEMNVRRFPGVLDVDRVHVSVKRDWMRNLRLRNGGAWSERWDVRLRMERALLGGPNESRRKLLSRLCQDFLSNYGELELSREDKFLVARVEDGLEWDVPYASSMRWRLGVCHDLKGMMSLSPMSLLLYVEQMKFAFGRYWGRVYCDDMKIGSSFSFCDNVFQICE
jgi:hypothetical protein